MAFLVGYTVLGLGNFLVVDMAMEVGTHMEADAHLEAPWDGDLQRK
jgi:hypothetical protein